MDRAPRLPGAEELLDQLVPILSDGALTPALDRTVESLALLCGADAAAMFLFERDERSGQHWYPDDASLRTALEHGFTALAADALRGGPSAVAESLASFAPAARTRVHILETGGRVHAVLCLALPLEARAEDDEAGRILARILSLVTQRIHREREAARMAAAASQYDHWFKLFDRQIRVLERERQKFAAVVNQTDLYVFATDACGVIRWANRALNEHVPPSGQRTTWVEATARELLERLGQTACEAEPSPVQRALETGQPAHRESTVQIGGAARHLYSTALPIKRPDGGTEEVLVLVQDLSDLAALRSSEARYRLLFERSASAIVMADPGTRRIVLANPAASRLTGYSAEQLVGLDLERLHPASECTAFLDHLPGRMWEEPLPCIECHLNTREGHERIAIATVTRFDLDGREVVMIELRDITERRHAEARLERAEQRLQTVVAHSPIILFATDREGRFTLSEGKGLQMLGLETGAMVGRSAFDVYRDVPRIVANLRRTLAGEELVDCVEVADRCFETRYTPIRDANGSIDGLIGVATDITEHRRLEEELRHSQKMEAIGRLAGGIAHDFNNLLTAITGHGQLLSMRLAAADPLRPGIEEILRATMRGAHLTRELLAFARREVVAPRSVDLNAVITGMQEMLGRLIGENIALRFVLADQPAWVRADLPQLEQVILNLALNARDAMPRGGGLTLSVELPAVEGVGRVSLTVRDDGCGMDQETRARLFEPFFTTKARGRGTGLGLSIVYGVVQQCGGEIEVDSAPGRGTTVRLLFPRAEELPSADNELMAPSPARGSETVLLVEDDAPVRDPLRTILTLRGYTVLEAESAEAALALAEAHPGSLDLLVTDVVLPALSGGELAQRLCRIRPGLRVLYISGYNDDDIVRAGVRAAGAAFLQKPFDLEVLARRVRDVLDARPGASAAVVPATPAPEAPPRAA